MEDWELKAHLNRWLQRLIERYGITLLLWEDSGRWHVSTVRGESFGSDKVSPQMALVRAESALSESVPRIQAIREAVHRGGVQG